jgi:hypothetical protein
MSNNIAVIEQEANEALSENRRELAEETAKVDKEPDLSEEAKARYTEEARGRAQAKYAEIIDGHDKAISERLELNEKRLFKLSYPKDAVTDSQKEAFRASYRQAAFHLLDASEEAVSRMMTRAFRTRDTVLEQAAYHESIERGLSEVGGEYRERYPKAAEAWNTYVADRRAAESREHILAGALLKTQDA